MAGPKKRAMGYFLQVRAQTMIKQTWTLWLLAYDSESAYFTTERQLLVFAGGAISNMYSVMIARYKFFPEVKTKGMTAAPRLVLFTSEHVSPHCLSFTVYCHTAGYFSIPFKNPHQCHTCRMTTDNQYVSFQSHYSIKKASATLGFGTENLILLKTDERFAL